MANNITIQIEAKGAEQVTSQISTVQKAAEGLGAAIIGTTLGFGAFQIARTIFEDVGRALAGTVQMAEELHRVQAQTNAVLKSTGGISGATADEIRALAVAQETLTGIDEVAIQTAENMLLTFTNIGHETLPDVTQAVLDMATAMGGGAIPTAETLSQTAIQVGKALNDPIDGVTALQRVGVKLSDQQKDLVEDFIKAGKGAEAQAVILKELQTEFGGSAEAASKARGGVDQAQDAFMDAARDIGEELLPVLQELERGFFSAAAEGLKFAHDLFDGMKGPMSDVIGIIGSVAGAIRDLHSLASTPITIGGINLGSIASIGSKAIADASGFTALKTLGTWGSQFLHGAAMAATGQSLDNADTPVDPFASEGDSLLPSSAGRPNGAKNFNPPKASGGSKALSPLESVTKSIADTLQKQLIDAYRTGGEEQYVTVKAAQERMMTAVRAGADEVSQKFGVDYPEALKEMFDAQSRILADTLAAQQQILTDAKDAEIAAYLEGGQQRLAIVTQEQQDRAVAIGQMAADVATKFGLEMPDAIKMATTAADAHTAALKAQTAAALDLTKQLWAAMPNASAQQLARFGGIASALAPSIAGGANGGSRPLTPDEQAAVQAAVDAANAATLARNPEIAARNMTNNITVTGIVGDPVATGQAIAAALNAAASATGPVVSSAAVGE